MPSKIYKIKWVIDDSQAQASFRRGVASLQDVEKAAGRMAGVVEKAFARNGAAADDFASRVGKAGGAFRGYGAAASAAAAQAAGGFDRSAAAAESAAARSAAAWVRVAPSLSAPLARLALESAGVGDAMALGWTRAAAAAQRAMPVSTKMLTDARTEAAGFGSDLVLSAKNGVWGLDHLAGPLKSFRADTATATAAAAAGVGKVDVAAKRGDGSVRGMRAALADAGGTGDRLGTSLGRLGAAALTIQTVERAGRALSDSLKHSRDRAIEATEANLRLRDSVRELKAIQGDNVTTSETIKGVHELMLASGGTQQEMIAFKTMFESALPAAKRMKDDAGKPMWELSDKDTKAVQVKAARFAVANQIDPATVGRMVPSIGTFGKVKTADDVMGQLGMMHRMGVEAVGRFTPVMKDYNALAGSMVNPKGGGGVKSPAELVGLISAVTVTSGTEAKAIEQISSAWKELSFANNKEKSEAFKKLGIVPGKDDYVSSVEKIKPLLVRGRAAGKSDTETLSGAGFKLDAARRAIIKQVGTADVLREQATTAATRIDPKRLDRINDQFRRDNPDRFAQAAQAVADSAKGEEQRSLVTFRKFAEAGMKHRHAADTAYTDFAEKVMEFPGGVPVIGGFLDAGQGTGRERATDAVVSQKILARVPDAAKRFPDLSGQIDVPFVNRLNPTFQPARGKRLADVINALSEKERQDVQKALESFAQPPETVKPGPQAMNEPRALPEVFPDNPRAGRPALRPGPVAFLGPRELLAAGLIGALPKGAGRAGLAAAATRRPNPGGGFVTLPTDPDELERVKGLGAHKPVSDAERDRVKNLGVRRPVPAAERQRIANLGVKGRARELAAAARVKPAEPVGDEMDRGKPPEPPRDRTAGAEAAALKAYNPYDELEGAGAWPGYSPRGGKIGSMAQIDTRTNAERALASVGPKPDGWVSSGLDRAMGGVPIAVQPASTPAPPSPAEAKTLETLVAILAELKAARPAKGNPTPAPLPLMGPRAGPGR